MWVIWVAYTILVWTIAAFYAFVKAMCFAYIIHVSCMLSSELYAFLLVLWAVYIILVCVLYANLIVLYAFV